MPHISLRQVFRPAILGIAIGLATLTVPLAAAPPAGAATVSPASVVAVNTSQHLMHRAVPDNQPAVVHTTTQFLRAHPSVNDPNICHTAFADLPAGNYEWKYIFNGELISVSGGGFTVRQADKFEWVNCLITEDGFYVLNSSLFDASLDQIYDGPNVNVQLSEDGQVTWGSEVQPLF